MVLADVILFERYETGVNLQGSSGANHQRLVAVVVTHGEVVRYGTRNVPFCQQVGNHILGRGEVHPVAASRELTHHLSLIHI